MLGHIERSIRTGDAFSVPPSETASSRSTPANVPAPEAKREDFASLKPAFDRDDGAVPAGNARGINDGAAAVIPAREEAARIRGS